MAVANGGAHYSAFVVRSSRKRLPVGLGGVGDSAFGSNMERMATMAQYMESEAENPERSDSCASVIPGSRRTLLTTLLWITCLRL
jgi:hypothetical protein